MKYNWIVFQNPYELVEFLNNWKMPKSDIIHIEFNANGKIVLIYTSWEDE